MATEYKSEFLKRLLREMVLIRRFEEKSAQMYGLRKIGGFCHLYIGQEAVSTGSIAAIDLTKDYVLTAYRDHGHAISCGMDPKAVMAELYGKIGGCSRGKGGSMHLFDAKKHFLGGNGIVGAHIPIATGVGFKIKYMNEDACVLCFFGEGAIHQGVFHESLNIAKIWSLPVVYIIENNHYGMGTHYRRVSAVYDLYKAGDEYGIPGSPVDGMDVLKVYEAVQAAVTRARQEKIPTLLEVKTYRYRGHSMSDPAQYRTREELEEQKKLDPILILKTRMMNERELTDKEYAAIEEECRKIVDEAVKFAEESPDPALSTLYEDVLA